MQTILRAMTKRMDEEGIATMLRVDLVTGKAVQGRVDVEPDILLVDRQYIPDSAIASVRIVYSLSDRA